MRRLYLSFIALFFAAVAMAQSVTTTFDFTKNPFAVPNEGKDTTSLTLEQDGVRLVLDTIFPTSFTTISPQLIKIIGVNDLRLQLNEGGFITKVQFFGHDGKAGIRDYELLENQSIYYGDFFGSNNNQFRSECTVGGSNRKCHTIYPFWLRRADQN